mgnify:CR=1 FL=1|tara:strand:- start:220 stop:516 length:297 start_codon:yes stop_codon:yes gene_type:complete
MEPEVTLRWLAAAVAVALLLSNMKILSYFNWSSVKKWFTWNNKPNRPVDNQIEEEVADKPFLEIIDLWYSLKEKCTDEGLDQAAEKLDEVFPLFNAED